MNAFQDLWADLQAFAQDSPLNALATAAAAIALATIPLAYLVLARTPWFKAHRGRVTRTPSFAAVVSALLLTMGIPAILLALFVKSQYYDRNRYEFDPSRVSSVLDQGRQFELRGLKESLEKADEAVRAEQARLTAERRALIDAVKKLDSAMLTLGEAALRTRPTSEALSPTVQALANIRKAVGVDADPRWQELVAILNDPERRLQLIEPTAPVLMAGAPMPAAIPAGPPPLSLGPYEGELSAVPAPQKPLALLLPLDQIPNGWTVADLSGRHLETFNAENLFEKINGRAESFIQYDVDGMAFASLQPADDPAAGDVQLYVFSFASPLKAFGKYGSERPPTSEPFDVGSAGYLDGTSAAFHADKFFVQIISSSKDPRFGAFVQQIAHLVANRIQPPTPAPATAPAAAPNAPPSTDSTPAAADPIALLNLLPKAPNRDQPQYVAQDVFGYSFLSDVFLAGYRDDNASWQAFLRPYATPADAITIFDKYLETARADGATVTPLESDSTDRMAACLNPDIGLYDVVFLKGNTLAGVNGSTDPKSAETFARQFARGLPATLPALASAPSTPKTADTPNTSFE